ncbi:hypothetical protein GCM10020331_057340 [Ectobacillus funiculus]
MFRPRVSKLLAICLTNAKESQVFEFIAKDDISKAQEKKLHTILNAKKIRTD